VSDTEMTLEEAERSSALLAANTLLHALGWSYGGLHAMACEIVSQRDALRAELAALRAALVEADEPAEMQDIGPEWKACVKLPITVHVREQRPGEGHISTREGITPCRPDDLIMRGVAGEEYPISREVFERTYVVGDATLAEADEPPRREPQLNADLEALRAEVERLADENGEITDLNQTQFLELERLRRISAAAHRLYDESEEYEFDDGLGRGAPQDLWDALSTELEGE